MGHIVGICAASEAGVQKVVVEAIGTNAQSWTTDTEESNDRVLAMIGINQRIQYGVLVGTQTGRVWSWISKDGSVFDAKQAKDSVAMNESRIEVAKAAISAIELSGLGMPPNMA